MADNTTPSAPEQAAAQQAAAPGGPVTVPGTPVVLASSSLYEDDRALDVLAYVRSLARFKWPALIVALLVLLAGIAYTATRPASYTGEATVLLVPEKATSEAEATQQAAMLPFVTRSYAYMVNSPLVMQRVVDKMGEPYEKVSDVEGMVTTGYPANSLIIRINGKGETEADAIKLTNLVADEYVAAVPSFSPGAGQNVSLSAKVIARAEAPLDPNPSTKLQLAAVSVVGALAMGFGVAVALDVLSRLRKSKAAKD